MGHVSVCQEADLASSMRSQDLPDSSMDAALGDSVAPGRDADSSSGIGEGKQG